jgi:hypothetical protein
MPVGMEWRIARHEASASLCPRRSDLALARVLAGGADREEGVVPRAQKAPRSGMVLSRGAWKTVPQPFYAVLT